MFRGFQGNLPEPHRAGIPKPEGQEFVGETPYLATLNCIYPGPTIEASEVNPARSRKDAQSTILHGFHSCISV